MANLTALEKGYWQYYQLVRELPGIATAETAYLKRRIFRIMFLSYLRAGKIKPAFQLLGRFFK
jgi:hypothetical protein